MYEKKGIAVLLSRILTVIHKHTFEKKIARFQLHVFSNRKQLGVVKNYSKYKKIIIMRYMLVNPEQVREGIKLFKVYIHG